MTALLGEGVSTPLRISPESFRAFCRFITTELGIKMSEAKIPLLQSRLQRRLRILQLDSIDAYREYLFESPGGEAERVNFIDAVTTNKTDFFREPQHFEFLDQEALPSLEPRPVGDLPAPWLLKLWCAGCSTGEEPYTLAMVLSEFGQRRGRFDFSILGTDISTRVLAHAETAIYDEERIDPVPPLLRGRYLLQSKDPEKAQVRIVPALRSRVRFHRLNFMDPEYPVRDVFDVIFFRNVMIYFDKPTQEAVINKLCRNLRPGGYLFVGHSESLSGLRIPVEQVATAVYRRLG
ncbi:chemotaxis protein CheR [Opitutaceae bacterium EW11]|nr:chemotaxis protein CheR [Opitutaceae bacterium EW11]